MDILKLKTFYKVAKLGSLTQASAQLNYSVPNLSRQIASLEEDLRAQLFHRKGNKLTLTTQGERLFPKAAHILAEIESARNALQEGNQLPAGLLRVSATYTLASIWITPYLKGFLAQYPDIRLSVYGDDRTVDLTIKESDVVISHCPSPDPDIIQTYLMTSHIGLYASKAYLKEFGMPTKLDDLDHHRLIARSDWGDLPYHSINWALIAGRGGDNPRQPYLSTNSIHSSIELALAGVGIACLSDTVKDIKQDELIKENQLIRIFPNIDSPSIEIFYMYHKNMQDSKRIKCFQDYLLTHIPKGNK